MSEIAHLIAAIIGLPDWSPRAVKRLAFTVFFLAAVFTPKAFEQGIALWAQQETTVFMHRIQPLLDNMKPLTQPTAPGSPTPPQPGL